jgi:hypothetical protein
LHAVSAAGVKIGIASVISPAPHDHFLAGPDCCVVVSGIGHVRGAGSCPYVRGRVVSSTGVQRIRVSIKAAPDNHFVAGPHCRVKGSCIRRVAGAGRYPGVCAGIVSPAGTVYRVRDNSAPHNHLSASPHRSRCASRRRRISGAGRCPAICVGIVSPAGIEEHGTWKRHATPDDHFTATPHPTTRSSRGGCISGAGGRPSICARVISSPRIGSIGTTRNISAPDNHFATTPNGDMTFSGLGRITRAGGRPTVRAGIVSPASVQIVSLVINAAPYDHFAATPHCPVKKSPRRGVGQAGVMPAIGGWIISAAIV